MTTIVADKTGMASDSQMTDVTAGVQTSVTKFWRVRGWLIGGAGSYPEVIKAIAELRHHKDRSPVQVLSTVSIKLNECDLLLLSPAGKLYLSEDGSHPMPVQEGFAALGTGAQGAMVAMHMGASPAQAVRQVKKVDPSTGGKTITRKL